MKTNCSSEDYDFYTIPFPVKEFLNNKDRYICSQLEKLHPCFSDDCSYDSHLRLEKSGLIADVVVMQKFKVAEYKANKQKLYVPERRHHQFFTNKKKNALLFGTSVFIVILLFVLAVYSKSLFNKKQTEDFAPKELPVSEQVPSAASTHKFFTPQLLSQIINSGGSIKDFTWSYDCYNEKMSTVVYGLYPEQIEDVSNEINISPVSFKESAPVMTINFIQKNISSAANSAPEYSSFKNDFRSLILLNKVIIIEETVNPYGIKLSAARNNPESLRKLINYIQQKNKNLSYIKISSNSSSINVELIFAQMIFDNQTDFFQSILNCLDHLVLEKTSQNVAAIDEPLPQEDAVSVQNNISNIAPRKKLGQIIKPDGSVIQYYKDEKGKIIQR